MRFAFLVSLFPLFFINTAFSSQNNWDFKKYPPGTKITDHKIAEELFNKLEKRPIQPWIEPDINTIPKGEKGDLIRYGMQLLTNTSELIGPHAKDKNLRFAGNNLNCTSCHQTGPSGLPGTKKYSVPWTNVINDYPQLDTKTMTIFSLEMRIAGMIGTGHKKISPETKEMKAMVAYMTWLGSNSKVKPNQNMVGTKLNGDIVLPNRPSDHVKGKALYSTYCSSCHGEKGLGLKKTNFESEGGGYTFPPVAGNDTYDDGGHMFMIPLMTAFLYNNMPQGATYEKPLLSIQDAYDISAYVNTNLARRHNPNRKGMYPDAAFRPEGFAIKEYFENDEKGYEQSRFGPYKTKNWW
jgi:cytochrome c